MEIVYSRAAIKALKRMPAPESMRIRQKIEGYATDPASQTNNVVKLQGREGYRLRVGDWRVIFDMDEDVLAIIAIGPRGGIYD